MVMLLIYRDTTGVFSSWGLAKKLKGGVAFGMLTAGNLPKHRTICEFRARKLDDFLKLYVQVV